MGLGDDYELYHVADPNGPRWGCLIIMLVAITVLGAYWLLRAVHG